ncbi:MAG TPA: hypothetical protein VKB79_29075 [Bryobacteraceae bacterium]|nr:hypothetical protein [Bryobacteraceae bacterium]
MASPAQCEANRANAQASTGPSTAAGKSASSRNATKFGLFATNNCILPGEELEYDTLCKRLWLELDPVGALEEATAAEYVRAVWRLRRCAMAEERLGWRSEWMQQDSNAQRQEDLPPADPAINQDTMAAQASVDRARAQAQNSMRRAKAELDKLQATRSTRTISQNEPNSDARSSEDEAVLQNEAVLQDEANSPVLPNQIGPPKPIAPPRSHSPRNVPCPCGSGLTALMCRFVYRHAEAETEVRDQQPPETALEVAA